VNSESCVVELAQVKDWVKNNNLRLNCAKQKKSYFEQSGNVAIQHKSTPPCEGIERVSSLAVLGVVIYDRMTPADHISGLVTSCSRLLYALRELRHHGIPAASMNDVFKSTVLAKFMYTVRLSHRVGSGFYGCSAPAQYFLMVVPYSSLESPTEASPMTERDCMP